MIGTWEQEDSLEEEQIKNDSFEDNLEEKQFAINVYEHLSEENKDLDTIHIFINMDLCENFKKELKEIDDTYIDHLGFEVVVIEKLQNNFDLFEVVSDLGIESVTEEFQLKMFLKQVGFSVIGAEKFVSFINPTMKHCSIQNWLDLYLDEIFQYKDLTACAGFPFEAPCNTMFSIDSYSQNPSTHQTHQRKEIFAWNLGLDFLDIDVSKKLSEIRTLLSLGNETWYHGTNGDFAKTETYEVQYRIPFNRDMFSLPNRKCMEVVVYFLFKKLNKELTQEIFRNCWPIIDKKSEQEFRKLTIDWITRLKKDDQECNLPNVNPSLLISPSGEKFYQFLFYFSVYILKQKTKVISKKGDVVPVWVNISNMKKKFSLQIQKSLMSRVVNRKTRLINYVMETFSAKGIWIEYARDLNKEHHKLLKEIRICEENMKVVKSRIAEQFKTSSLLLKDPTRSESLQQIKIIWDTISAHFETQKKIQEQVKKILDAVSFSLDGDKINFDIPAILVNDCERMLHYGKRFQNVYEEGQLNILSLVELWNLSLQRVRASLNQSPLHHAIHEESYIRNEVINHSNYLNHLESIRLRLASSTIPDIQKSIKNLEKSICGMSSYQETYKDILDSLPTTPVFHFEFSNDNDDHMQLFKDEYTATPYATRTPYAVDDLLCRLNDNDQDETPVRQQKSHKENLASTLVSNNLNSIYPAKKVNNKKIQQYQHPQSVNKLKKSRIPRYNVGLSSSMVNNAKDEDCVNSVKRKSQVYDKSKPHEILLEQIAQSVFNFNKEEAGSSSDEEVENSIHALYDPFEAFSKNPFLNKERCVHTPGPKSRQSLSNLPLLDIPNSPSSTENIDNIVDSSFCALSPIHDCQTLYSPFETSNFLLSNISSHDYNLLTPFCNLEMSNIPQRSPSSTLSNSQRFPQGIEHRKSLSKTFERSLEELSDLLNFDESKDSSCIEHNSYAQKFFQNNFPELTPERLNHAKTSNLISFYTPEKHPLHIDVTNDDVNNFIEEVISNTPGYLMKTPSINQNNFHLLSPEKL